MTISATLNERTGRVDEFLLPQNTLKPWVLSSVPVMGARSREFLLESIPLCSGYCW